MDLSLEFPDKYHTIGAAVRSCRDTCALEGMINFVPCQLPLFWRLSNNRVSLCVQIVQTLPKLKLSIEEIICSHCCTLSA